MRDAAADLDFETRRPPARRDQAPARDRTRHHRRPAGARGRGPKPGLRPRKGQAQQGPRTGTRSGSATMGRRGRPQPNVPRPRRDGPRRRLFRAAKKPLFAKPSLDDMGPGTDTATPAGAVSRSLFKKQSRQEAHGSDYGMPDDARPVAVPQEYAGRDDGAPHRKAGRRRQAGKAREGRHRLLRGPIRPAPPGRRSKKSGRPGH